MGEEIPLISKKRKKMGFDEKEIQNLKIEKKRGGEMKGGAG